MKIPRNNQQKTNITYKFLNTAPNQPRGDVKIMKPISYSIN